MLFRKSGFNEFSGFSASAYFLGGGFFHAFKFNITKFEIKK